MSYALRRLEIEMTEQFWWGVVAGLVFMGICWALEKQAYRSVLLNIARNGGREKLGDGAFYRIVPETASGCVCCANGNDLPEGEYCRACGTGAETAPSATMEESKLSKAVKAARGGDAPNRFRGHA